MKKKTPQHVIYVARIDHLHYSSSAPSLPAQAKRREAPSIDPKKLNWGNWLHYQCKRFAWVGQMALAIVVFLASRISLGFGVRLNGGDA